MVGNASYTNSALTAPMLPDMPLEELWPGQPLQLNDPWLHVRSAAQMSANHAANYKQAHLHRTMRHGAVSCWVTDRLASKKKCTVIREQKSGPSRKASQGRASPPHQLRVDTGAHGHVLQSWKGAYGELHEELGLTS